MLGTGGVSVLAPPTAPRLGGMPAHMQGEGLVAYRKSVGAIVGKLMKEVFVVREPEEAVIGTVM